MPTPNENQIQQDDYPKLVTDPKTGLTIKVTPEILQLFEICEAKIRYSLAEIAMALKCIRDNKLYLLLEIESMGEYLSERWTKSKKQAYFYMKLADAYSDSPHYQEIASLPQKVLAESFKDENMIKQLKKGELTDQEGEVYTFEEIKRLGNKEFQIKFTAEKRKVKEMKTELEQAQQDIKLKNQMIQAHDDLKENNAKFQRITSEKETLRLLHYHNGLIAQIASDMDQIETSPSIEAVSQVKAMIGNLAGLIDAIEDKWAVNLIELGNRSQNQSKPS